jgi:hypothetical protein
VPARRAFMEITRGGGGWEWCGVPAMKAEAMAEGFSRGVVSDARKLEVNKD